jgi:hypothetical protein
LITKQVVAGRQPVRFTSWAAPMALWHADRVLGENGLVEGLWRQQLIWSQTANRLKGSIGRARSAALALTVGGAVLAALATRLPAGQDTLSSALTVAAAVGVGLVPREGAVRGSRPAAH